MITRTYILVVLLLICFTEISAQQKTIYVIGDNVNIRYDTTSTKSCHYQVDWGTRFEGKKVSENWYSPQLEYEQDPVYISSTYAVEEKSFYDLAQRKKDKSGRVKFEIFILSIKYGERVKTDSIFFDIIQNNSKDLYTYADHEWCRLLGPYSYKLMLENKRKSNNFTDRNFLDFTEKVFKSSPDSVLKAIALIDQTKYYLRNGNMKLASDNLFTLLTNYSENMVIPMPCEYDLESRIYPLITFKNLLFSMIQIMTDSEREIAFKELSELNENCSRQSVRGIIQELFLKVDGTFWKPYSN